MEYALLQAVFLPVLLSPIAYIIGRKLGPTPAMWFTFGLLLYTNVLVILAALSGTTEEHYPWPEQFGEFGFLLDGLASPFAIIIYVLSTILALYSKPYMIHRFHEQYEEEQHEITSTTSGHSEIVESSSRSNYVNAKSGLYFALHLVFAMGMLGPSFIAAIAPAFFFVPNPPTTSDYQAYSGKWQYQSEVKPFLQVPESITIDKWYFQYPEPVRILPRSPPPSNFYTPAISSWWVSLSSWYQNTSTPVFTKPIPIYSNANLPRVEPEVVKLDKWYQPASEPTRNKLRTADFPSISYVYIPPVVSDYQPFTGRYQYKTSVIPLHVVIEKTDCG